MLHRHPDVTQLIVECNNKTTHCKALQGKSDKLIVCQVLDGRFINPLLTLCYLKVQRCELLFFSPRAAFKLINGPGWLSALPSCEAAEPQLRVQWAAFHLGFDRGVGRVVVLRGFGGPLCLGDIIRLLSLCLIQQGYSTIRGQKG